MEAAKAETFPITVSADDLLAIGLATGMRVGEALSQIAGVMGEEAAKAQFEAVLAGLPPLASPRVMDMLRDLASQAPALADTLCQGLLVDGRLGPHENAAGFTGYHLERLPWLTRLPEGHLFRDHVWLTGGSALTSLPEGLVVQGFLMLSGCLHLEAIPCGVKVRTLEARGCASLRTLGAGLVIDYDLDLRRCPAWDGRIPDDAVIGRKICTNQHPGGMGLAQWREAHPSGEPLAAGGMP